jgi:hypothetical protein
VANVPLENRATIGNMSPEYGSTVTMFPVDDETLRYLRFTGRSEETVALVEAYVKEQGMWHEPDHEPVFTTTLELDLSTVEPSLAGPKRPQDRVRLADASAEFEEALESEFDKAGEADKRVSVEGESFDIGHGDVVIAAITSCTNTSNPNVMIGAGILARKAVERFLALPEVQRLLPRNTEFRWGHLPLGEPMGADDPAAVRRFDGGARILRQSLRVGTANPREEHQGLQTRRQRQTTVCHDTRGSGSSYAPPHPSCGSGDSAAP